MQRETILKLFEAALKVQVHAYAPYSKFMVGAAILTQRGSIYTGCNVECADYDGTHAEESAISAMVAGGERSIVLVLACGALEGQVPLIIPPCGKCRQKLYEFSSLAAQEMQVVGAISDAGAELRPLSSLLVNAFGPADIGIDLDRYRRP